MKFKQEITNEKTGRVYEPVSIDGLCPEMMEALPIIDKAFIHEGFEAVCASGTEYFYSLDGFNRLIHSFGSDHYKKAAVDISCLGIATETAIRIQNEIQQNIDLLRKGYYVLFHGTNPHLHIGWRP